MQLEKKDEDLKNFIEKVLNKISIVIKPDEKSE
jgi:hypothetical protein